MIIYLFFWAIPDDLYLGASPKYTDRGGLSATTLPMKNRKDTATIPIAITQKSKAGTQNQG